MTAVNTNMFKNVKLPKDFSEFKGHNAAGMPGQSSVNNPQIEDHL